MVRKSGGKRTMKSGDDPPPGTSSAGRGTPLNKKQKTDAAAEAAELESISEHESDDVESDPDLESGESMSCYSDEEEQEITGDVMELLSLEIDSPGENRADLSSTQTSTTARPRQRQSVGREPPFRWTPQRPSPPDPISFSLIPGLTNPPLNKRPIHYFNQIFTMDLITKIVDETNNFGEGQKASITSTYARIKRWRCLTVEEFTLWLGLLFHMGNVVVCRLADYWSTDPLYNFPLFRTVMGRDRFINILNCLHFHPNPPPNQPQTDLLYKIRPLVNYFHHIMENVVTPTRRLCIDESMVLWKNRWVFRVSLKGKRQRYGTKLYMLTEPSGLVLRVVLYSGLGDPEVSRPGHVDSVVNKLMEGKLDLGHSLFMDSYYNSVQLAHQLLKHKTYVTGPLRKSRKNNPIEVLTKKLNKFESTCLFSDRGIGVIKWKDYREVLMLSSEYGPDLVDVIDRRGQISQKPEMVAEYNKSEGGIDQMDQLLAFYPMERKCLNWYRKVAIHIFHLMLFNSYILYKKDNPNSKMSMYDFRMSIVRALIAPAISSSLARTSSQKTVVVPQQTLHLPQQRPLNKKNRRVMRRCILCSKSGIRKESSYYCPSCPGEPNLCASSCFREFHKAK